MFDFKLPDLGEGVHEGQVVNVLVKEGDAIAEYQPMLEIETDKAAVEIPSPKGGRIAKVHVNAGQTVKVGQVLISIEEGGNGQPAARPAAAAPQSTVAPASAPPAAAAPAEASPAVSRPAGAPSAPAPAVRGEDEGPVPAAPAVRKLALH